MRKSIRAIKKTSLLAKMTFAVCLIAVSSSLMSFGAFSTFTGTADTSASNPITTTCTMTLAGIGTNAANNRLTLGASNIVPGDTMQRTVNAKNSGSSCLNATTPIRLTSRATGCLGTCQSSLLNTDTTNGLQMAIDKCSVAWTEAGVAPAYTYTCGGTTTSVLASVPVIQTAVTLNNIVGTSGTDNFLRVTLSFPVGAGNTFQNLTSQIEYELAAQQRAGTNQ